MQCMGGMSACVISMIWGRLRAILFVLYSTFLPSCQGVALDRRRRTERPRRKHPSAEDRVRRLLWRRIEEAPSRHGMARPKPAEEVFRQRQDEFRAALPL